jgi:hypothetical protein
LSLPRTCLNNAWFGSGRSFRKAQAKTIFSNLLDVGGKVEVGDQRVVVTLDHRAHNPILAVSGLLNRHTPMPWFYGKELVIRI